MSSENSFISFVVQEHAYFFGKRLRREALLVAPLGLLPAGNAVAVFLSLPSLAQGIWVLDAGAHPVNDTLSPWRRQWFLCALT